MGRVTIVCSGLSLLLTLLFWLSFCIFPDTHSGDGPDSGAWVQIAGFVLSVGLAGAAIVCSVFLLRTRRARRVVGFLVACLSLIFLLGPMIWLSSLIR